MPEVEGVLPRSKTILAVLLLALVLEGCGAGVSEGSGSNPSEGGSETGASRQEDNRRSSGPSDTGGGAVAEGSMGQTRAAQCYVDAVNDEDLDALVGCFAPDGVVVDVSRRIEGRDAIREWAEGEVIGGTLRVIESEPRPNGVRLLVHWAPAGSDGWRAYYTFDDSGGEIVRADLQYA